MSLNRVQEELLRALIDAQVATLEWGEKDTHDENATVDIDELLKKCKSIAKRLRSQ